MFFFFDYVLLFPIVFFFFFSTRRRHTRWTGDWSSDVCFFRSCGGRNALADPREILAEAFRFPDDLTGQAAARLRTRTRVGTEAVNLLLQPLNLGGSCPNGGWDGFVVGFV